MDKKYIDREYYCNNICRCPGTECDKSKCPLWTAPAADVVPVVHGEWVYETDEDAIWRTKAICSACKCVVANNTHLTHEYGVENFEKMHKFCPNCSAKMDGGAYGTA